MRAATIEPASQADAAAILTLLQRSDLPTVGAADHVANAVVARDQGVVIGCAALEIYGDDALLRSVAVDGSQRGGGLGHRLTEAALARAVAHGVRTVYLLTTTAERFFPKFGFVEIDRSQVPAAVRGSVEFTSACPASAIVMRKRLNEPA
jgi:amino-acid N-acetyltransferase